MKNKNDRKDKKNCSICGAEIDMQDLGNGHMCDEGCSAEPVTSGTCCSVCNIDVENVQNFFTNAITKIGRESQNEILGELDPRDGVSIEIDNIVYEIPAVVNQLIDNLVHQIKDKS